MERFRRLDVVALGEAEVDEHRDVLAREQDVGRSAEGAEGASAANISIIKCVDMRRAGAHVLFAMGVQPAARDRDNDGKKNERK